MSEKLCPTCGVKVDFVAVFCTSCGTSLNASRLESLQSRLQQYMGCEAAILSGAQEYSIGSRRITRGNLHEIAEMITYLERQIAKEQSKTAGNGRNRVIGIIPRDL